MLFTASRTSKLLARINSGSHCVTASCGKLISSPCLLDHFSDRSVTRNSSIRFGWIQRFIPLFGPMARTAIRPRLTTSRRCSPPWPSGRRRGKLVSPRTKRCNGRPKAAADRNRSPTKEPDAIHLHRDLRHQLSSRESVRLSRVGGAATHSPTVEELLSPAIPVGDVPVRG